MGGYRELFFRVEEEFSFVERSHVGAGEDRV